MGSLDCAMGLLPPIDGLGGPGRFGPVGGRSASASPANLWRVWGDLGRPAAVIVARELIGHFGPGPKMLVLVSTEWAAPVLDGTIEERDDGEQPDRGGRHRRTDGPTPALGSSD